MQRRAGTTRFVGRDAELATLDSALERARGGDPSVTLVLGEYGIGKTRLMRELERRARRQRLQVLSGACVPLTDGELPYGPIGTGLRDLPSEVVAGAFAQLPAGARALLSDAFPQLPATDEPSGPPSSGGLQQVRFYEFLLGLLQRLGEAAPLLVVIEDFHIADGATRNFVAFLLRNLRRQRIALVLTYRREDMTPEDRAALEDHATGARCLELGPLEADELEALITDRLGHSPPGRLVREIASWSAGNPLFAEELLAARVDSPAGALPRTLADSLLRRVRRLSPDAERVALVASAAARPVGCAVLGGAAVLPEPQLSGAVREALDGNVLERLSDSDAFQFRYEVVRKAVYDDLLPGERADLHARVAATLREHGAALGWGELAYHWHAAGNATEAITASLEAARATAGAYAFEESLAHFERALELADTVGGLPSGVDVDRADLLHRAAETARCAGASERAVELARSALEHIDPAADPLRAARLHELWGHCQSFDHETALRAFREAKALLPAARDTERARVLAAEAKALICAGTWDEVRAGRRQADAALALALTAGAGPEEAQARIMLGLGMALLGEAAQGARHLAVARALARELGRADELVRSELYLGEALRLAGDFAGALAVMDEGRAHAAEQGMEALFGRYFAFNAAEDLFVLGRWTDAERRLEAAAVEHEPTSWNQLLCTLVAGQLALGRGDGDRARVQLERAQAVFDVEGRPPEYAAPLHAALAELALEKRDHEAARRLVDAGRAIVTGQADLLYTPALYSIGARVEADAADAGRTPRARAAHRAGALRDELAAMLPMAAGTSAPPSALAHLALCRAEVARAAAEPAVERWADAATAWEAFGAPYRAAYARLRQAAAVLEGQRDPAVAADLLRRAYDTADELGAEQLRVQAKLLAGRNAEHLRHRGRREQPASERPVRDFDLTAREREVLALVAEGLTNRAIAARLVISEKTAGVHVTRILRKLDVHDRRVAATRAYQLGLASPEREPAPHPG